MKTLIVYYSRTKTTKKVAEALKEGLDADIEEIIDTKDRSGPIGYLSAGKDATLRRLTKIEDTKNDPADYGLVIIGTPTWSWNVSTPVRTYLKQMKDKFNRVAFFCTMGGSGYERVFKEMQAAIDKAPVATLTLLTKEVARDEFKEKLNKFRLRLTTDASAAS